MSVSGASSVPVGEGIRLEAAGIPIGGTFHWTSKDPSIAEVAQESSTTAIVTGVTLGFTKIINPELDVSTTR